MKRGGSFCGDQKRSTGSCGTSARRNSVMAFCEMICLQCDPPVIPTRYAVDSETSCLRSNRAERSNPMFKRILVPLDGSHRAEQALPVAARLAQASGARVVLLRVVSMANQFANYVAMEPLITEREIDLRLEEAKDYLRNLAHSGAMHEVDTKTLVFFGQPAANILSVVDLQQIDLVVM